MRKNITAMTMALLLVLAFFGQSHAAGDDTSRSLSPYFYIQGDADSGVEAFPLLGTKVDAQVSGVIARVTVTQRYANRGSKPIHAKYIFPGSTRAAVHGLKMTIGDRVVRAKIKEKEEARRIYEVAKKEGKSASLLEQQRPNVFSMNVANIMPGDVIDVELEYSELLVPTDGVYEFVYPTVVGPRYASDREDPNKNNWVANPYLREGDAPQTTFDINVRLAAGMPVQDVACSSHDVKVKFDSPEVATVSLGSADFGGNRDYILNYRLAGSKIQSGLMLFEGKDENFFLLMAQPPQRPTVAQIPGRDYIFVVDVSGSMHGFPLDTAKTLLKDLVGGLRPEDRFNMIFFSGTDKTMSPQSVPATSENIFKALAMLDGFSGGGGTELLSAMRRATSLPATEGYSRSVILITDGYISAEDEAIDLIRANLHQTNLFAFGIGSGVNRHLIEGLAKVGRGEPFIVTSPADAPLMAARLRDYIASPVLTDIEVKYDGFEAYDVEPFKVPDLFAQRPMLVFGKWNGKRKGSITVSGVTGNGRYEQTFKVGEVKPDASNSGLRYLWARERLAQVSDYAGTRDAEENRKYIVALGLKYNLLTAHTSFVAVDEVVRNKGGQGEDVKQPLPEGVSELAVGGDTASVPEPEFMLITLLALLLAASLVLKDRAVLKTINWGVFKKR